MFTWFTNFFKKTPVAPVLEIKYCEDHGKLLAVTNTVVKYSPYTGDPLVQSVVKTCPVDGSVIESHIN